MKRIFYGLGLAVAVILSLCIFNRVFAFKHGDGIYSMEKFYELEENTVDVLAIGSSHVFENINPMVIWEESDIAVYDLCGSMAPMWNSYYYLKEALKTQRPKLVILDIAALLFDAEYMDESRIVKNTYGMKWSRNKLNAMLASISEEEFLDYSLEWTRYHSRYNELSSEDYRKNLDDMPYYSCWKGSGDNYLITPFEQPVVKNDGSTAPLPRKQEEYFRKIIQLCKSENLELLIVKTPYSSYTAQEMAVYNSAQKIAKEESIPYINFNEKYDEIGFDWNMDFSDPSHLSYLGNAKFSRYLSDYLVENYQWNSHSTDAERYASWDEAVECYHHNVKNHEITLIEDTDEYLKEINNLPDDYIIILKINHFDGKGDDIDSLRTQLDKWGIDGIAANQECMWLMENQNISLLEKTENGYYYAKRFGNKELVVDKEGIYWNRKNVEKENEGISLLIFDKHNQLVVDSLAIEDGKIQR